MKKHIKVTAATPEGFSKVLVKVLEQTHRNGQFGVYDNKFRASNGIVLASNSYPAKDTDDKNVIWLRGNRTGHDNTTFAVSASQWPKVAQAIREYNEFNFPAPYVAPRYAATAPAPRPVGINACAVIIG